MGGAVPRAARGRGRALAELARGARVLVWAASRYDAELIASSRTRVLLLGSTSVYSEEEGQEVTEGSATAGPLVAAERATLEGGGCVLRLAGLYSRERGPQTLLASAPRTEDGAPRLEPPGERLLNLVHEEDAARAALFALERDLAGVWNVSDGAPLTRARFYSVAAQTLSLPGPVFDLPGGRPGLGRRVSNRKLLASGFEPLHEDLAKGLLG